MPWSTDVPPKCRICGKLRPRVLYGFGKAHRKCIEKEKRFELTSGRPQKTERLDELGAVMVEGVLVGPGIDSSKVGGQ